MPNRNRSRRATQPRNEPQNEGQPEQGGGQRRQGGGQQVQRGGQQAQGGGQRGRGGGRQNGGRGGGNALAKPSPRPSPRLQYGHVENNNNHVNVNIYHINNQITNTSQNQTFRTNPDQEVRGFLQAPPPQQPTPSPPRSPGLANSRFAIPVFGNGDWGHPSRGIFAPSFGRESPDTGANQATDRCRGCGHEYMFGGVQCLNPSCGARR